MKYTVYIDFR